VERAEEWVRKAGLRNPRVESTGAGSLPSPIVLFHDRARGESI